MPYLVGYRIDEGYAVLVTDRGRVVLTASLGFEFADNASALASQLGTIRRQYPQGLLVLIAFHPDIDSARSAVELARRQVPPDDILESIYTNGERWWSSVCTTSCCPAEGRLVPWDSQATAAAVYAGMSPADSRDVIKARVSGPGPTGEGRVTVQLRQLRHLVARWSPEQRAGRLDDVIEAGLRDPDALDDLALLELAVLVGTIPLRDRAWLAIDRHSADEHAALWQRVVEVTPDEAAVAPLCLTGIAGWMGGHGTLLSVCVERAGEIDPAYSLVALLQTMIDNAIGPEMMDDLPPHDELCGPEDQAVSA